MVSGNKKLRLIMSGAAVPATPAQENNSGNNLSYNNDPYMDPTLTQNAGFLDSFTQLPIEYILIGAAVLVTGIILVTSKKGKRK